jgi:hypothetical protein
MGLKRMKALIWKQKEEQIPAPVATISKSFQDEARRSLIKLFRDSLHLNDHASHSSPSAKDILEENIIEDFQMVSDYMKYLEMWLERFDIVIED